jgi:predicted nucleic acid-binding protein
MRWGLKLVVDTNIILKALIRDSPVRALLLNPEHSFCVPEHTFEELEKHMNTIVAKSGLSREEIQTVLSTLLTGIRVLPANGIAEEWESRSHYRADRPERRGIRGRGAERARRWDLE